MSEMTSLERVFATLEHKEPDRVPVFLSLTMHGAKELGLSIREYFSNAENVLKGQLILREKYNNDMINPFFYAGAETEAWGGDIIYYEDGPPNAGKPPIINHDTIRDIETPNVDDSPVLQKGLRAISLLKDEVKDDAPIIGTAIAPFSLPVMQLGFNKYIELIYEKEELFNILMEKNKRFAIQWANAQLAAGATAVCYFDPVSSPTIIPREVYLKTGFKIASETISKINGPTATHFASGRTMEIIDDVAKTGTVVIGVSSMENLAELKERCRNRLTVLGNLNGVEMCRWTPEQTEAIVKQTISQAAPGGGFVLSDNHGEIPYQVPDNVIKAISDAVIKWGKYPIEI